MKIVYILRGLPGSGKSTIATKLINIQDGFAHIFSADQFFINEYGDYIFNSSSLKQAHEFCRNRFSAAIKNEIHPIVIDNTNTMKWEYDWYIEQASLAGYSHQVIIVGEFSDEACTYYAKRNTHGVPLETIIKMRNRFEH